MGAVYGERFNRTIRDLLKRLVFQTRAGSSIVILPTKTKQNNNRVHSSPELPPIQASLKKNEGYVFLNISNISDKRNKIKPKFKIQDLVRTADLKKTFSKRDTTNWL